MSAVIAVDVDRARRLTERIRRVAQNVAEQVEELRRLVGEAKATEAHVALGYASWTAYLADLFGDEPLRLARDVRKELVAELHNQGMSTRAIAPIVGVHRDTVAEDIRGGGNPPPSPIEESREAWDHLAEKAGAPSSHSWDLPAWADTPTPPPTEAAPVITSKPSVTGLDGKTYPVPPKQQTAQRKPLTAAAKDAGWDIRKAAERLTRIREDDRFSRQKEEVASHLRGHLEYVVQVCQDLLDDFDQSRRD